ncbi:MAG: mechanosensitive ion channel family protein [Gammaproteobacteria bacterium]|nr:mechanosensitive ion channel family protein [Gammaproteobacteria bacterium]MBT8443338.1 mechanosensitive ion channel family protein [Gammaproteobacteria bacterium]NND36604.1 mechanosensitive ion channel family protein [Gammaproteobacteria bacterium]
MHVKGLLFSCLVLAAQLAFAQGADAPADGAPEVPKDEFNRGTPMRSVDGFLAAADRVDFATAAEHLDLRNLRGSAREVSGETLARQLDVIAKRAEWLDIDEMSDDPAGKANDDLPAYRDSIGLVRYGERELRLLMQRVPRDDGVLIWKVSNATVSLIPELHAAYSYPPAIELVRRNVPQVTFLGFELFAWIVALSTALTAYAVVFVIALATRRLSKEPSGLAQQRLFRFLTRPVGIWAAVMSASYTASWLGRGVTGEAIGRYTPIPTLVTVWLLFSGVNVLRGAYAERLHAKGRPGAAMLLHPASNAFKLVVAIAALLVYLDKLGVNITTVLAGLGVGGLAVALALQKPMEDVLGAISIFTQQPFRVGDFCRIGPHIGNIEEVGLRTTRLRTLANTVISIPNARVATEAVDNISARQKIWYRPILRLRYDTTPTQLEQILDGIRELFAGDDRVLQDNHRVRFKEFADDALLLEAYAYLDTTDWAEFLEMAEQLNIAILKIITEAGTSLALPARSLHVEQEPASG